MKYGLVVQWLYLVTNVPLKEDEKVLDYTKVNGVPVNKGNGGKHE